MKKRVWAIVCLTLFITAQTLTNIKVMASTIDSFGQELLDYMTLESMSIALTEGTELDWSDLDLGDALISTEEKARRMLSYYRNKAWQLEKNGLLGIVDMMTDVSVSEAQTPAIAFTLNSGLSNSTINSLYNQVSNNALGISNDDYTLLMNNPTVAYWNKYNNLYLNQYLENMNYQAAGEEIVRPEVPSAYQSQVNRMNALEEYGFTWKNAPQYMYSSVSGTFQNYAYPADSYTWVSYGNLGVITPQYGLSVNQVSAATQILTLDITSTSVDGVYTGVLQGNRMIPISSSNTQYSWFSFTVDNNFNVTYKNQGFLNDTAISMTYTGSLENVLNWYKDRVRNVNIVVDGVTWVQIGYIDLPGNTWGTSIPNAVTDTGTDDGKIVAAPIFWATDENTGQNIDEWQINLTNMMQKIIDKIDAGETTLSMQDLVDADAVEGTDGVAIGIGTGVVAGTKSLADAIAQARDASITDNPAITLEDVAAEAVPGLPIIPAMPAGMPGFGGVTVLARIVNFANQSLPTELIVTFWGVIFGAVVLGIIKVLHK